MNLDDLIVTVFCVVDDTLNDIDSVSIQVVEDRSPLRCSSTNRL